jgi:adenylylsulfate kinase-like enzyme
MVNAGVFPIVSPITPFQADRELVRARFAPEEFYEIFVDAPLRLGRQREPESLYAEALCGELARCSGIDSRYEAPSEPELHLHTDADNAEQCVERIVQLLGV